MKNLEASPEAAATITPIVIPAEPLFDIQLQVARRADTLARRHFFVTPDIDRRLWLRAELEVLDGRLTQLSEIGWKSERVQLSVTLE